MTACLICYGPIYWQDRGTRVVQSTGFRDIICGACMRDDSAIFPERTMTNARGEERPIPPRVRA